MVITVHSLRLLEEIWDHEVKSDWKAEAHIRIQTVPSCSERLQISLMLTKLYGPTALKCDVYAAP